MIFTNKQSGMTLVEVIVVTSIFTVVMLALTTGITSLYRVNSYTIAQAYEVDEARRGMDRLIRDVREMTFADDGTFPLAVMDEHSVSFYSDIDRDDSVEYIEYELVGTNLEKRTYNATGSPPTYDTSVADETQILSTYVQNTIQGTSTFLYYDTNGAQSTVTTNVTDIRYIRAQLIVNIDPVRSPGEFMLRSSAALRNLKDNL